LEAIAFGTRGGVGGWRGSSYVGVLLPLRVTDCVLFHPPLPEPCLQLSPHTALQWPDSQGFDRVCCPHGSIRLSPNHTPGISPTWPPTAPVHLPPFALWPAFPASDYYEGSVALGLAPHRRSRLLDLIDVIARVRCPVRPVEPLDGGRSLEWKPSEVVRRNLVSRGSSEQAWYRGVGLCTAGDWGSSNPTFTMSCGPRGATSYTSSDVPRFDGMLLSPLAFAAR
jgi:hypothetical protein